MSILREMMEAAAKFPMVRPLEVRCSERTWKAWRLLAELRESPMTNLMGVPVYVSETIPANMLRLVDPRTGEVLAEVTINDAAEAAPAPKEGTDGA